MRRRRSGGVAVLLLAFVAVAGLITVLATHRDAGTPNPNSAVIAVVPPVGGSSVTVTVGPLASAAAPSTLGPPPGQRSGQWAGQWTGDPDAPWPAPPADPTAAVDMAIADAAAQGVSLAMVVTDRTSGAVLVARDADRPYPSLSLLKVMIAADVLTTGWPTGATAAGVGSLRTGTDGPAPESEPEPGPETETETESATDLSDDGSAGVESDEALPVPATQAEIDDLLTRMIATSDDEIASDLYDAAGGDDLVNRVAQRYGLTGTTPTPDGTWWGNVQVTASDMATLLSAVLADPRTGPVIGDAMRAATAIAADGVDQRFGLRLVPGAGSKQGWGCCLSGQVGIHSIGFTGDRIVVVLSAAEPDDESLGEQDGSALQADPGAQASFVAVDAAVRAALGGPAG